MSMQFFELQNIISPFKNLILDKEARSEIHRGDIHSEKVTRKRCYGCEAI